MRAGCLAGAGAVLIFAVSFIGAILACYQEYSFWAETLSATSNYGWFPTILLTSGLILGGLLAIPFFGQLGKVKTLPLSLRIGAGLACFSCSMLIFTGVLLQTDEPWNHAYFAYLFFLAMAIAIALFAATFTEPSLIHRLFRYSGMTICPIVFLLAFFSPGSLIPIFQKVIIVIYVVWLSGFGFAVCSMNLLTFKGNLKKDEGL